MADITSSWRRCLLNQVVVRTICCPLRIVLSMINNVHGLLHPFRALLPLHHSKSAFHARLCRGPATHYGGCFLISSTATLVSLFRLRWLCLPCIQFHRQKVSIKTLRHPLLSVWITLILENHEYVKGTGWAPERFFVPSLHQWVSGRLLAKRLCHRA